MRDLLVCISIEKYFTFSEEFFTQSEKILKNLIDEKDLIVCTTGIEARDSLQGGTSI